MSNHSFWLKYESSIHNNVYYKVKVISSDSREICTDQVQFRSKNSCLCRLLVNYDDVFISCLDSHFDGTHSMQRIHWWASDVMLHFSKSAHMKKQTHLHLGWPKGETFFRKFSFLAERFLWLNYIFIKQWNIHSTYDWYNLLSHSILSMLSRTLQCQHVLNGSHHLSRQTRAIS